VSESARRYPLSWPTGWTRTPPAERKRADFGKTIEKSVVERYYDGRPPETRTRKSKAALTAADAAVRLERELDRLGADDAKLSTSQKLRLDGTPRSDLSEPTDPGAAVYFRFKGRATVLACDRWTRVADNIAAIAQHIDAIRRMDRYGVGSLEQALAGYKALPADTAANWRAVFGFAATSTPTIDQLNTAFKEAARQHHPDRGGTEIAMAHVNRAREYALMELQS
jgi:hypothetical protein